MSDKATSRKLGGPRALAAQFAARLTKSGIGITASLIGTIGIFLIIARLVGPEAFGQFSLTYAICSIFGIIFDFGLRTRLLKDTHDLVQANGGFPARLVHLKVAIFVMVTPALLLVFILFDAPLELFLPVWSGISLISAGNFLGATLQSAGHYGRNGMNVLIANLIGLALVLVFAFSGVRDVYAYSWCITLIGFCHAALSIAAWSHLFTLAPEAVSVSRVISEIRASIAYTLDAIAQRGFAFTDTIILSVFVGDTQLGIYQAGQKIMQGALPFAQAINQVILPPLARNQINPPKWRRLSIAVLGFMILVGLGFGAILALFGPDIVSLLYGSAYDGLRDFIWIFGLAIAMRYAAAGLGTIATSIGMQKERATMSIVALVAFALYACYMSASFGAKGMAIAIAVSGLLVSVGFLALLARKIPATKSSGSG